VEILAVLSALVREFSWINSGCNAIGAWRTTGGLRNVANVDASYALSFVEPASTGATRACHPGLELISNDGLAKSPR